MDNCCNLLDNDSNKARLLNNYFASVFTKDNSLMSEFEQSDYDSCNKMLLIFLWRKLLKPLKGLRPMVAEVTIIYLIYIFFKCGT